MGTLQARRTRSVILTLALISSTVFVSGCLATLVGTGIGAGIGAIAAGATGTAIGAGAGALAGALVGVYEDAREESHGPRVYVRGRPAAREESADGAVEPTVEIPLSEYEAFLDYRDGQSNAATRPDEPAPGEPAPEEP